MLSNLEFDILEVFSDGEMYSFEEVWEKIGKKPPHFYSNKNASDNVIRAFQVKKDFLVVFDPHANRKYQITETGDLAYKQELEIKLTELRNAQMQQAIIQSGLDTNESVIKTNESVILVNDREPGRFRTLKKLTITSIIVAAASALLSLGSLYVQSRDSTDEELRSTNKILKLQLQELERLRNVLQSLNLTNHSVNADTTPVRVVKNR